MKTPSPDHLEGFFHGMEHLLSNAEQHDRIGAAKSAIRKEITTLKLLDEARS